MPNPAQNLSYRDIKQVVLDRIQNGIWPPDSLMPNEADLVEEFSSTRTTVNRALRELAEEGFIERKRKAGTRVLQSPIRKAQFSIPLVRDEITAAGASYSYTLIERSLLSAPAWLSASLGLTPPQEVLHLKCLHHSDDAPFQLETRWIVPDVVPEVLDEPFEAEGPNDWLVKRVPFTNLELSFTASAADTDIARFLNARPSDPIFTAERTTWLRGKPVTHAKLYFAPGYRMTTLL